MRHIVIVVVDADGPALLTKLRVSISLVCLLRGELLCDFRLFIGVQYGSCLLCDYEVVFVRVQYGSCAMRLLSRGVARGHGGIFGL